MTSAKKFLMLLACLVVTATGFAGKMTTEDADTLTASKVFADIPLSVLDMIRPSARLDMLDYYEHADSLLTVADALGGQSRFEVVTPDYLKVAVSPVSTLEIKILPYKKGNIVMTLSTVGGAGIAKDTEVRFFNADLQPLPLEKFLKAPSLKDFFDLKEKNSEISITELTESIPFTTVEYTTGPADTPLNATFTTLSTLSEETRDLLTPYLNPSLKASWTTQFKF